MWWLTRIGILLLALCGVAAVAYVMPARDCPAPSAVSVVTLFAPCLR